MFSWMTCFFSWKIASFIIMPMIIRYLIPLWTSISIFLNLKIDCKNAIDWFAWNGMKANPSKFQFMMLSMNAPRKIIWILRMASLRSEPCAKVLEVTIDDRLQINEHVSAGCSKAPKQLDILSRIPRHISLKSKYVIYNSFIESSFNYFPLVGQFCGATNNNKLEKLQEPWLRIGHNDFESPIQSLYW